MENEPLSPPLDVGSLRERLRDTVAELTVVSRTGSTNADLSVAARDGAPDRTVLVAELQDSGRGRLDRRWSSSPGAGLTFSVLLWPQGVPPQRLGWLPLLAGVALVRAVRAAAVGSAAGSESGSPEPVAVLKWPNDLLVGPRRAKCAGLLAEVPTRGAVVVGIGLNTHAGESDLPPDVLATSLRLEGIQVSREGLLVDVLGELLTTQARWREAEGDAVACGLLDEYREYCSTLGSSVRVDRPGGALIGTATQIDADGRLLVTGESGAVTAVAAGDVVHLRPAK
ncbi:MAG TPA: biotin--[acetyl-CoA-carboxylase] ligase [Pseudonocardia sp.]|nr:biotin--[acetyl-CoA-carboxylase] ligase [Pseudonocardia sp.]